eukprot:s4922_g3.t1
MFMEVLTACLHTFQLTWKLLPFESFLKLFPDNISNGAGGAEEMFVYDKDGTAHKASSSKHAALYAPGRVLEIIVQREEWIIKIRSFLHSMQHMVQRDVLPLQDISPQWFIRTFRNPDNLISLIAAVWNSFRKVDVAAYDPGPGAPQRISKLWAGLAAAWQLPLGILGSDEKREPMKARLLMVPKRLEQATIDSHSLGQSEKRLAVATVGVPPSPQSVLAMRGKWHSSCLRGEYQGIPPCLSQALGSPYDYAKGSRSHCFHRSRPLGEGLFVAIDWPDFNSFHSVPTMVATYFALLCTANVGAPHFDQWAWSVIIKMLTTMTSIFVPNSSVAVWIQHRLASGLRATGEINALEQVGYIRVCVKLVAMALNYTVLILCHYLAGDDGLLELGTFLCCLMLMLALEATKQKIRPEAQRISRSCSEFLRTFTTDQGTSGFVCRSLGNFIIADSREVFSRNPFTKLDTALHLAFKTLCRGGSLLCARLLLFSTYYSWHRVHSLGKTLSRHKLLFANLSAEGGFADLCNTNWIPDLLHCRRAEPRPPLNVANVSNSDSTYAREAAGEMLKQSGLNDRLFYDVGGPLLTRLLRDQVAGNVWADGQKQIFDSQSVKFLHEHIANRPTTTFNAKGSLFWKGRFVDRSEIALIKLLPPGTGKTVHAASKNHIDESDLEDGSLAMVMNNDRYMGKVVYVAISTDAVFADIPPHAVVVTAYVPPASLHIQNKVAQLLADDFPEQARSYTNYQQDILDKHNLHLSRAAGELGILPSAGCVHAFNPWMTVYQQSAPAWFFTELSLQVIAALLAVRSGDFTLADRIINTNGVLVWTRQVRSSYVGRIGVRRFKEKQKVSAVAYILTLSMLAPLPSVFQDSLQTEQGAEALITKLEFVDRGWTRQIALYFDEPTSALVGSSEYAYDSDQNVVAIPPARPGTPRNGPLPPTPVNLPASTSSTPVVPSWVTLEPVGIWREVEEDATTTTSTTLTVDEALTGDEAADTVAEDGTTLENDGVDAISMVQRGIWTLTTSTSSTTTTTSELTWPSEVVRDTVNVNLVYGGLVDVVELIHRLQARQRHLRHCDRLLMDAIEEALSWIQVPLTTTPMNVGTFERNIWAAVTAEARFGSGTSSTQTSQMVSAPSALLQGGFPTTLAQLQEVVPGAPQVAVRHKELWVWLEKIVTSSSSSMMTTGTCPIGPREFPGLKSCEELALRRRWVVGLSSTCVTVALVEDAAEDESPDGHQGFLVHEGRDLLLVPILNVLDYLNHILNALDYLNHMLFLHIRDCRNRMLFLDFRFVMLIATVGRNVNTMFVVRMYGGLEVYEGRGFLQPGILSAFLSYPYINQVRIVETNSSTYKKVELDYFQLHYSPLSTQGADSGQGGFTAMAEPLPDATADEVVPALMYDFGSHICPHVTLGGWWRVTANYASTVNQEKIDVERATSEAMEKARAEAWGLNANAAGTRNGVSGGAAGGGGRASGDHESHNDSSGNKDVQQQAMKNATMQIEQTWKGGAPGVSPSDWRRSLDFSMSSSWKVIQRDLTRCIGVWSFVDDPDLADALCARWIQLFMQAQNLTRTQVPLKIQQAACSTTQNMQYLIQYTHNASSWKKQQAADKCEAEHPGYYYTPAGKCLPKQCYCTIELDRRAGTRGVDCPENGKTDCEGCCTPQQRSYCTTNACASGFIIKKDFKAGEEESFVYSFETPQHPLEICVYNEGGDELCLDSVKIANDDSDSPMPLGITTGWPSLSSDDEDHDDDGAVDDKCIPIVYNSLSEI